MIRNNWILAAVVLLAACQDGGSASAESTTASKPSGGNSDGGTFEVRMGGKVLASDESTQARMKISDRGLWEFKARDFQLRISGRLPDSGGGDASGLRERNTNLSIYHEVDGKRVKLLCRAGSEPQGSMNVSRSNGMVSGVFTVTITECKQIYQEGSVTSIGLPWEVSGQFSENEESID